MNATPITKIATLAILIAAFVLAARPSGAAVATNITVPFSTTITSPCNGDLIDASELVHALATVTFDAAGFHVHLHFNTEQGRAIDTVTGITCTTHDTENTSAFNFDLNTATAACPPCPPLVFSFKKTGTISCPGAGGFVFTNLVHVTVNANGTITADVDTSPGELKCK